MKATPGPEEFANCYFDDVGGEILDLMLGRMARHGRIGACGSISTYNEGKESGSVIKNWLDVIAMRIQIKGFVVMDFYDRRPQAMEALIKGLEDGKLQIEEGEQVVKAGFEDVPKTWMLLFQGANTGKLITAL